MYQLPKLVILFGKGVQCGMCPKIQTILGFWCGSVPFRYLGATVVIDQIRMADFEPWIVKIRGKISTWKEQCLSFVGKVTLVKTVFQSVSI